MSAQVRLESGALMIQGKPTVLLCSSFFYFRIPREYWRRRMRDLKKSGYNAIDVYFPWNYHEVTPGEWDFSGERDVAAFLQIAAEENLYVVARPGPYICSEWDGGGIPIWVHMQCENVRQYDPTYLAMLTEWMRRILPVIKDYQLGQKGSIVLLQLENELDLYPCRHANRYMQAIRDLTDSFQLETPYVACVAGKGDVDAATGSVARIAPSFNIYPPFSDPTVEEKMEIIQKEILMPRGLPLLATETEREHNFMRRELASGVRLISPYCQTATTNFDCRNGVCAWSSTPEKRIVYITNDYDMGSMLKADGAVTREFLESRLLANFFHTMGEVVAAGTPFAQHEIHVETTFRTNDEGVHAMALAGGGELLCLPNLSREEGEATITVREETFRLRVEGDTTRLLLFDMSMARWGYPSATIVWTALDLGWIDNGEMVMYGQGDGVCLSVNGERRVLHGGDTLTVDGKPLTLRVEVRETVARMQSPYLPAFTQAANPPWESEQTTLAAACDAPRMQADRELPIEAMERFGAYGGRALYQFDVPNCKGLMLLGATDIAALWVNGEHQRTWISDASMQRLPVTSGQVTLRTEIWGHTCFDETYNRLLHMNTLRGLEGAWAIREERLVQSNWRFSPDEGAFGAYVTPVWSALPCLTDFGTLIPKGSIRSGLYRRELRMPEQGDTRWLSLEGLGMDAAVYVNGKLVAVVDRTNPYVEITEQTVAGRVEELILRVRADSCESLPGRLCLIGAKRLDKARVGVCSVAEIAAPREISGDAPTLPLRLHGGEAKWLKLHVTPAQQELWLRPEGKEIMVTAVSHGRVLGRLMPQSDINALFRSGDALRVWLPKEWLRQDTEIRLLVEGLSDAGELNALWLDQREGGDDR